MKKLGLLLCVVVLSLSMFACDGLFPKDNPFPEGDNFTAHQRRFYNDTISKVTEFVDLTDDELNLSQNIGNSLEISLSAKKTGVIEGLASGIASLDTIDRLEEKCQYVVGIFLNDFSYFYIDWDESDESSTALTYGVISFTSNAAAKEFYNLSIFEEEGYNVTLSKNKVMFAFGSLPYDKKQVLNALTDLKNSYIGEDELPTGLTAHQQNFYNDTISKVTEFVDLTDSNLYFDHFLNENVELDLSVKKTGIINGLFSVPISQNTIDKLEENCQYALSLIIVNDSPYDKWNESSEIDMNDFVLAYGVISFSSNAIAQEFYNLPLRFNEEGYNITLYNNNVIFAVGNMTYNKKQVLNALDNLKKSYTGENELPKGLTAHQQNFYNDTVSKVTEFVDLTKVELNLNRFINQNIELELSVSKSRVVEELAFGKVSQNTIDRLDEKCQYSVFISLYNHSFFYEIDWDGDDENADLLAYGVICFTDNAAAQEFYNLPLGLEEEGLNMILSNNKVIIATGSLAYDKNQVLFALDSLLLDCYLLI